MFYAGYGVIWHQKPMPAPACTMVKKLYTAFGGVHTVDTSAADTAVNPMPQPGMGQIPT